VQPTTHAAHCLTLLQLVDPLPDSLGDTEGRSSAPSVAIVRIVAVRATRRCWSTACSISASVTRGRASCRWNRTAGAVAIIVVQGSFGRQADMARTEVAGHPVRIPGRRSHQDLHRTPSSIFD
jgi:hypothetical protein